MSTVTRVTAKELLELPAGMGKRYELVAGELRISLLNGWIHGQVVGNLHALLAPHIRTQRLGWGFGAETGFLLSRDPDTVRAPDFAFIAKSNLPATAPDEAFWPGAPDLAVEVLSPGDRTGEVNEKIAAWLTAGCRSVWIIDPSLETVTVYHSRSDVHAFGGDDVLQDDLVVPGFSCPVAELFV